MTKERLRRLISLSVDYWIQRYRDRSFDADKELRDLQAEFEAWEPEKERGVMTRQELLELLFRLGRLMPWERDELENLRGRGLMR